MYTPDVLDIKSFYASTTGQIAVRILRRYIREWWSEVKRESLLGLGYACPYLSPFIDDQNLGIALMPAQQGVVHWPGGRTNLSLLADDLRLPFHDNCFERIIVAHSLEFSDNTEAFLQEIWRVLAPGGRLLVIVPNRSGIWSRVESTPFGHGRPFSRSQLVRLLEEEQFSIIQGDSVVFMPPSRSRFWLRSAGVLEKLGSRLCGFMGGIVLMEAEKQVFAIKPVKKTVTRRSPVYIPITQPALNRKS